VDFNFNTRTIALEADSLCFTYCQIPIVYKISNQKAIEVRFNDGSLQKFNDFTLDLKTSKHVFERTNEIHHILVHILESELK
jgi:hypothetical protein